MTTTPFTVIIPKQITEGNLVSTNVPEPQSNAPTWVSTTNYNLGDLVSVTTGYHKVYESLTGSSNQGHFPPTDSLTSTPHWVEVGPTNRWAMFDSSGGTITENPNSIQFSFTSDRVTSMAFIDVVCDYIEITASNTLGQYYYERLDINDRAIIENWYDYFTVEQFNSTLLITLKIPSVAGSVYSVNISQTGGVAKLGNFVFGESTELGLTQYNPTISNIDYSKKEVDAYGKASLIERPFSKKMDVRLYVDSYKVDAVVQRLNLLRATPCLWIGSKESYESLSVYGFYRDYSMDIAYPTYSVLSLQIEGLT
jgi:hypothetical protein